MSQLSDLSADTLYEAAQAGIENASLLGQGLIREDEGRPLHAVLATLARVRFIEQSLQLAAAKMLSVPLDEVAMTGDRLGLTILLHRVLIGEISEADAAVFTRGAYKTELRKAADCLAADLRAGGVDEQWRSVTKAIELIKTTSADRSEPVRF